MKSENSSRITISLLFQLNAKKLFAPLQPLFRKYMKFAKKKGKIESAKNDTKTLKLNTKEIQRE